MTESSATAVAPATVFTLHDLTEEHIGAEIVTTSALGYVKGELIELDRSPNNSKVTAYIRQLAMAFNTAVLSSCTAPRPCKVLTPAPELIEPIDLDAIRELASITDRLKALDGEQKDLKARKLVLSDKLVEDFARNTVRTVNVNDRTAYVHTKTFPDYQDRPAEEGGGKYAAEDVIPVLRTLNRAHQITPETVNWMTMGAILREYRDLNEPVPAELARLVVLDSDMEIRVRAPGSK
jgi:hypothetical protein